MSVIFSQKMSAGGICEMSEELRSAALPAGFSVSQLDATIEDLGFIVSGLAATLICVYKVYNRRGEALDVNSTSCG